MSIAGIGIVVAKASPFIIKGSVATYHAAVYGIHFLGTHISAYVAHHGAAHIAAKFIVDNACDWVVEKIVDVVKMYHEKKLHDDNILAEAEAYYRADEAGCDESFIPAGLEAKAEAARKRVYERMGGAVGGVIAEIKEHAEDVEFRKASEGFYAAKGVVFTTAVAGEALEAGPIFESVGGITASPTEIGGSAIVDVVFKVYEMHREGKVVFSKEGLQEVVLAEIESIGSTLVCGYMAKALTGV